MKAKVEVPCQNQTDNQVLSFASERNQAQILSLTLGRVRVHLPGWTGEAPAQIEAWVRSLPGVEAVQANPRTGNVLIYFDSRATTASILLQALTEVSRGWSATESNEPANYLPGLLDSPWLRVGARGLFNHAAVDVLFLVARVLGPSLGLPLRSLANLHLLLDLLAWGTALRSANRSSGALSAAGMLAAKAA